MLGKGRPEGGIDPQYSGAPPAWVVPEEIIGRPKHGFAMLRDRWFRGELREMATEVMVRSLARDRGFFYALVVERIWENYLRGRDELFMQISMLPNFEVWCRVFLDGGWADLQWRSVR